MQSNTMAEVRDVLREVRLTIGSEGDAGERERQQARVKRMLTAMGVSEDDLDAELREHKLQQEADAAAVPEELQPNGDAHVGVAAGGITQQEGVGQDDDVKMDVEGVDMDVHDRQPGTQISLLSSGCHFGFQAASEGMNLYCVSAKHTFLALRRA